MEKRRPDSDLPPEFYIRHHIDAIYDCIAGRSYPKRLLEFIQINRWEFKVWCEHSGYPLPEFWYSVDYRWPDEDDEPEFEETPDKSKRTKSQVHKDECKKIASEIWSADSDLRVAEVARQIQAQGVATHFTVKTITNWIRSVAPDGVRNRPGRPPKTP
jgi:hypothetical protein